LNWPKEYPPVATTRPETIMGNTAVCVHPEDERYKDLGGKQAVVPMGGGRTVPIIADDYVDMQFGTGALKITPGHDPNDYAIKVRPPSNQHYEQGRIVEFKAILFWLQR
jgi:valyl-tRNA synthetase